MASLDPVVDKISLQTNSQARIVGVLAEGYRILLICNHILDNTKHPKVEDFTVFSGDEPLAVKAVFLASPMLPNSSWAGITLMTNTVLPKTETINVRFNSPSGLISLVDRRRLQSFDVSAQAGNQDIQDIALLPSTIEIVIQ